MKFVDDKFYHIALGLHSGIPECCIMWWLKSTAKQRVLCYRKTCKISGKVENAYMPCPKCLSRLKLKKIHQCDYSNPMCWEFVDPEMIKVYKSYVKYFKIKRKFKSDKDMVLYVEKYIGGGE